jgi:ABC-2 type transport system ATP-binding protein
MIRVNNLVKKYIEKTVLDTLSFTIHPGEILGIMGRNGAGKTTLIQCLLNETDYSGEIYINPELLAHKSKRMHPRHVYVMSDTPHIYSYLTGLEQVEFILKIKGAPLPRQETILEVMNIFGLTETDSHTLIKNYSFGMKRKVLLLAGFLLKPKLMILDEPTTGLDAPSVITLKRLIQSLSKQDSSFMISSHDPNLLSELSTNLIVLHNKKIAYHNPKFKTETRDLSQLYIEIIEENIDQSIEKILQSPPY